MCFNDQPFCVKEAKMCGCVSVDKKTDLKTYSITFRSNCKMEVRGKWAAQICQTFTAVGAFQANHLEKQWAGLVQAPPCITTWDTGVSGDVLKFVGAKSVAVPENFVSFCFCVKKKISVFHCTQFQLCPVTSPMIDAHNIAKIDNTKDQVIPYCKFCNCLACCMIQAPHPTLKKSHIERRLQRLEEGLDLDWATAEALAIGSLLYQGKKAWMLDTALT